MTPALRESLRAGALLALAALLAVALLAGIHALSRERIAAAERLQQQQALALVLPATRFDNDLLTDRITVDAIEWLGKPASSVYRARRSGAEVALILQASANDGYAGPIHLLIAIERSGRVAGVRITEHRETPGLGDGIERPEWLSGLLGRALGDPPASRWQVRRDGGDFDALAGATITPRAVIHAVRRCLALVAQHGDRLYRAESGAHLRFDDRPADTAAP